MNEDKWAAVWATLFVAGAAAEYVAIRSGDPRAPLSHHMRRALGIRKKAAHQRLGQVAFGAGFVWLIEHLYRAMEES